MNLVYSPMTSSAKQVTFNAESLIPASETSDRKMSSVKTLSQYREERQVIEPSNPPKEFEQSLKVLSLNEDICKQS